PAKTSPEGLRTTSPTPRRYGREAMSSVAAAMSVRGTVEEGQPLQDVEGIGKLVILGPARGDLLLALLLGLELLALVIREPVVLERTAQFALRPQRRDDRRFSALLRLLGRLVLEPLLDDDVGCDAERLDRAPGRRVVARGRESHGTVILHRDDRLHRSLAEALGADDDRPPVVLQGAGDDLRGRGGTAVDQHDDRLAAGKIARRRVVAVGIARIAAPGRDDLARIEEGVRHLDGLIEEASRVVAQVEDESLD